MIDVKMWGARGNGQTDDTATVQQALDQASRNGDTVYFPNGIYMINPQKPLRVGDRTKLQGAGRSTIIRAGAGSFGWELIRASGQNIQISDITLDGNNRVNRVLVIGGGSSSVTVRNVLVTKATHSTDRRSEYYTGIVAGIVVYGNSDSIDISESEISAINAVNLTGGSLIARGIYVTTTWASAERAAKRVAISNNYIHDIGPADDGDGIYYEAPDLDNQQGVKVGSTITGNRFDNCAKRAIKIYTNGMTISGNQVDNSYLNNNYYRGASKGRLAPDMYSAISLYGSDHVVENNIIGGIGSYYAAIEVTSGMEVSHITIQGNKISMGDKSTITGTTAIRLRNIRDFQILANTISNGEKGIWTWQNADSGLIRDNVILLKKGGGIDLSTYLRGYVQKNITCLNNKISAVKFTVLTSSTNKNVLIQ